MTKFFKTIYYYILILLGLILVSWMMWARFLRERVIRNIPDELLTEYRVWILVYICYIYIIVIRHLIKEIQPNIILNALSKIINAYVYKPLITLDHFVKQNRYTKDYYEKFMFKFVYFYTDLFSKTWIYSIYLLSFQIFPRIILVTFLSLDTFYFHKIEIFYKIILIGFIPFTLRYIEHSIKDFHDYLIKQLTDKYSKVQIFEKGYKYDVSRVDKTDAVWHGDFVPVDIFIQILYETPDDCKRENTYYEYVGDPFCKEEIYVYYEKKFKKPVSDWTSEENKEVDQLFHDLIPEILHIKDIMYLIDKLKEQKKIKWPKIIIFSTYLICWSSILIVSYYNYPVELVMFKYLIKNIMTYLVLGEDPFLMNLHSINENLITIENMKTLILNIINTLLKTIIK